MWIADLSSQIFISFVGEAKDDIDAEEPSFSFHVDLVPYRFTVPNKAIFTETTTVDIFAEENVSSSSLSI